MALPFVLQRQEHAVKHTSSMMTLHGRIDVQGSGPFVQPWTQFERQFIALRPSRGIAGAMDQLQEMQVQSTPITPKHRYVWPINSVSFIRPTKSSTPATKIKTHIVARRAYASPSQGSDRNKDRSFVAHSGNRCWAQGEQEEAQGQSDSRRQRQLRFFASHCCSGDSKRPSAIQTGER